MSKKIFVKTLVCQMNEYYSNRILDTVNEIGFAIDRQSIRLPEGVLKELGEFDLDIELHPEVVSKIKIVLKPE